MIWFNDTNLQYLKLLRLSLGLSVYDKDHNKQWIGLSWQDCLAEPLLNEPYFLIL